MVHVYITLHPRQNAKQNGKDKMDIAHACGRVCRWWDTYITPQSCQDCYRVYHASFNAKIRPKRHCACVWMDLQMVGHVYHTTIVPRLLSCISRFIQGKNKGKTPLRMRVDGFADGGTHISNHNRAKTDHLYIRTKNKDKCPCACVWTGLQMVGHIYRTTIVLIVLSCILSAAKTRAKRHCACVWTGLQMVGHIYHTTLVLACLCLFSEKAIVCLSDIPRTLVITYSTFCIY